MIALAAAILWQGRAQLAARRAGLQPVPIPAEPISIGAAPVRGVMSAPVAIIEYGDFECAFCARFVEQVAPVLLREYVDTGHVILVFKNFPLPIHRQAVAASEAAWCADRQGMYWEMHHQLFRMVSQQRGLDLQAAARETGLDLARYDSCRAGSEARQQVQAETTEATRLRLSGAPTFFFGEVMSDRRVKVSDALVGARSIEEFKVILDRILGPR
jgi:protein-disulfide isomerase